LGSRKVSGSLVLLVERLLGCEIEVSVDRFRNPDLLVDAGIGGRLQKRILAWLREAEVRGFDALVLVIDEDGDRERVKLVSRAQEDASIFSLPRAFGVAIRTFDAWMLADEKALSRILGFTVKRFATPERIKDPKKKIEALLKKAGPDAPGLSALYAQLAGRVELKDLETRCPKGFAPFAERVRAVA